MAYHGTLLDMGITPAEARIHVPFTSSLNAQGEVPLSEVARHLAESGITMDWMTHPTAYDYSMSYLRDWQR